MLKIHIMAHMPLPLKRVLFQKLALKILPEISSCNELRFLKPYSKCVGLLDLSVFQTRNVRSKSHIKQKLKGDGACLGPSRE